MGQKITRDTLRPSFKKRMEKRVVFNEQEMDKLYARFLNDYPSGYMTEEEFLQCYQKHFLKNIKSKTKRKTIIQSRAMTNISKHLFRVVDENNDRKIDFREFLVAYSLTKCTTVDKKLEHAFRIFDINGDEKLSLGEAKSIIRCFLALSNTYSNDVTDDTLKEIFENFDKNKDGYLSFEEFKNGSYKNPLLVSVINSSMHGKETPKLRSKKGSKEGSQDR